MIGTDLLDQGQSATVARPAVTLDFGSGSGLGAGAGGPTLADGLVSLRLKRTMAPDVDLAEVVLVAVPGGADLPEPGDAGTITVSVGDLSSSFACVVDLVERRSDGSIRMTATNSGRIMARGRVNLAFAEQDPGAIIDAIAGDVGATSAAGSAGDALSSFVADDRSSAWEHVAILAASAGRMAGFDDSGTLTLYDDTATGEAIARLAVGETLVDYRVGNRGAASGSLTTAGDGASDKGDHAWAWLRKDIAPVTVSTGSDGPVRRHSAPWLRAQPAVQVLADARQRSQDRLGRTGRFLVAGSPHIIPGSLVEVSGIGSDDGVWFVLAVTIRFDLHAGLVSEVSAAPAGRGGAP